MLIELLNATHHYDLLENAHYKPFTRLRKAVEEDGFNPNIDMPDLYDVVLEIPELNTNACFRHWELAVINMLIEEYANAVLSKLIHRLNGLSDAPVGTIIIDSDEFTFDEWEEWQRKLIATDEEIQSIAEEYKNVLAEFNVSLGDL